MRVFALGACVMLSTLIAASLSDLRLLRVVELHAETHHVQGIDTDGQRLWLSSVDSANRKGYLYEFAIDSGQLIRQVEVERGGQFHPGGIAADRDSVWLPVAEYRRESSSVIQQRNLRTLELMSQFDVADHIGCVTVVRDRLLGGNWDSRLFYEWDRKGTLLRKTANPTEVAYQDVKFVDGNVVASGLFPDRSGAVDWLEYPSMRLLRRITAGATDRGAPYTREGMALRAQRLYLLPEDSASRLFVFDLTPK